MQEALSEEFDGVDCSISPGPVLSQTPFRLPFRYLGRNVVYVPDVTVSCMEDIDTSLSRLNLTKVTNFLQKQRKNFSRTAQFLRMDKQAAA